MHGADGTRLGDGYRLITTLLDWRRYPAGELVRLYHQRWEIRHHRQTRRSGGSTAQIRRSEVTAFPALARIALHLLPLTAAGTAELPPATVLPRSISPQIPASG